MVQLGKRCINQSRCNAKYTSEHPNYLKLLGFSSWVKGVCLIRALGKGISMTVSCEGSPDLVSRRVIVLLESFHEILPNYRLIMFAVGICWVSKSRILTLCLEEIGLVSQNISGGWNIDLRVLLVG